MMCMDLVKLFLSVGLLSMSLESMGKHVCVSVQYVCSICVHIGNTYILGVMSLK